MKKSLFLSLVFLFLVVINPGLSFSQDTQSQSEQYRLQQIEKQQATKSATVATASATTKSQTISFVDGQITAINSAVILLETKFGTKIIYTADSTKFFNLDSSGKKLIGLGDLKAGDTIYTIGLTQLTNSGSAKIIVRDQTKAVRNFSLIGKIASATDKDLKLDDFNRSDLPSLLLTFSSKTKVTNSRQQTLKPTDLKADYKIVASGFFDEKNNLVAATIFNLGSSAMQTATVSAK